MILITNLETGVSIEIVPTRFPDGTSQVWKLKDLDQYKEFGCIITWYFSEEAELIYVNQLICLLYQHHIGIAELYIPFLPYGRQDKEISNETTFAREVFLEMLLTEMVFQVTTLDMHSPHPKVKSYSPARYIDRAMADFKPDMVIFPDKGALLRYVNCANGSQYAVLNKTRNQLTGEITGLEFVGDYFMKYVDKFGGTEPIRLLIVDDICDGGATFNNASIFLHKTVNDLGKKAKIGLYVTHGIYSKGFEKMIDSGITEFYTTQSLLKNVNGYELEEV